MKTLLLALGVLLLSALLVAGGGLLWAHVSLRGERAPLPRVADVARVLARDAGAPQALAWINTASQDMSRGAVLDPGVDPDPAAAYRMSHSSYVLEWANGRLLLIDVGMTPEAAIEFGAPSELVAGARPMEPHQPTAEQLGPRVKDVAGVVFSHLHTDHVQGIAALCAAREEPLRVFGTKGQRARTNYTTQPGLDLLQEAGCVEFVPIDESGSLLELPGFPGVRVIDAAGHTPGSQVVAARVGNERYVFSGDIANARDGILHDVPKPWWYSAFVVPEDEDRLGDVRQFLRSLHRDEGFRLLVPHDENANVESGVLRWAR